MSKTNPLQRNITMNLHIEEKPTQAKLITILKRPLIAVFFYTIIIVINNFKHQKFCSENSLDAKYILHPSTH